MTAASPRRLLAGAAIVLALPALGTVAYAAAHAVSNNPAPQRVIPIDTRSRVEDSTDTTDLRGPEAEPGDDRGDDNVTRATSPTVPAATHDAGDDHGGATTVSDDGPNHDLGDDHGGSSNTTAPAEDHSGSGSSNSGRGSDDSGHHGGDG